MAAKAYENMRADLESLACIKNGALEFTFHSPETFIGSGIIFDQVSKDQYIRIEKTSDSCFRLYYSTPGTGTLAAEIEGRIFENKRVLKFKCRWSRPNRLNFEIMDPSNKHIRSSSKGKPSKLQYMITTDGKAVPVGDEGVDVHSIQIRTPDGFVLDNTAIQTWKSTLNAVEILLNERNTDNYQFNLILNNLILSTIITGFEVYSKKRFVEIEREGATADIESLVKHFYSNKQLEMGIEDDINEKATKKGTTALKEIVQRKKINFQNYENCKAAFKYAYSINFAEIGLHNDLAKDFKHLLRCRHHIVHVSPSDSTLLWNNDIKIESTKIFTEQSIALIDSIITKLHKSTFI